MEAEITTKHLQGSSDLTLVAPIKRGLVSVLDTRTYASRLRAILQTLHTLRQTSREYSMLRTFSDNTDRIRTITDLRMVILEPEQKLLLSVTFDRPWEPYLRIIWREVGTLLDVIFCNCEGYPISFDHSFEVYGEWIRNARTNTRFFYKANAATYDDGQYLRQVEKLFGDGPASDLEAYRTLVSDPKDVAKKASLSRFDYTVKQGMQALAVLYRLADLYQPRSYDGDILLRASKELLRELPDALAVLARYAPKAAAAVRARFKAQLDWFESIPSNAPALPAPEVPASIDDAQGGILGSYDGVNCGCMLLLAIDEPQSGAEFLKALRGSVYTQAQAAKQVAPADGIYVNAGFTPDGLRACGLSAADLEAFPNEFLEGMQERAGLIGDMRGNHPRNWSLPERNWPPAGAPSGAVVQMSNVHLVVQMITTDPAAGPELAPALRAKIDALMDKKAGVRLLSVQPMRRYIVPASGKVREHFGFIDGISQPEVGTPPAGVWSNKVGLGDLLLGYPNGRGDPPQRSEWTDNGSFLVVRKLRQFVEDFERVVKDAAAATGDAPDDIKAKMMGRTLDGDPLASPGAPGQNDFNYDCDADGSRCPFAAHVRRANPRVPAIDGRGPVPRIARRGMSYGPRFDPAAAPDPAIERGLVFMAYNASIAEQFEVIQRWMSGGNSTGVLSDHRDPFLGVPQYGEARTFRYAQGNSVKHVTLDPPAPVNPPPPPSRPLVKLEWGLYVFAPSVTALKKVEDTARAFVPPVYARPVNMPPKGLAEGEAIVQDLLRKDAAASTQAEKDAVAEQWKSAFEDSYARSYGDSEAVWTAIRHRGGVLRTSYGVVVASKTLVNEVLLNRKKRYSVCGYVPRLNASIGQMYLGMDDTGPGCPYRKESKETNTAIYAIPEQEAFDKAKAYATVWLQGLIAKTKEFVPPGTPRWDTTLDVKEISDFTLAKLCELWFSLDGNGPFRAGGSPWDWKPGDAPYYPGHFTAPSRYVFQPNPGAGAEMLGQERGQAILAAMRQMVDQWRAGNPVPAGPITVAVLKAFPNTAAGNDTAARTILGTLIGFLPTVEGNFRATMNEWIDERALWPLQDAYLSDPRPSGYAKADAMLRGPLMRTMQFRPAPEVSWRTAVKDHKLGGVKVRKGDRIAFSLVSATQEDLAAGVTEVATIFGGDRSSKPHPTHACPGQKIGMGVLLGMITALVEVGIVRPTPAPLTVSLEGPMP